MAPLIDERARVHLAAPEIAGEAVQDAVRVIRDPVDAGAPLQRGRGSRGLRAQWLVDDVHRRRAEEEGGGGDLMSRAPGGPRRRQRVFGSRDFVRFRVRFETGRTRTDCIERPLSRAASIQPLPG